MQDPKTSKTRKPWYQKAVEITTLWKIIFKTPTPTNPTLWKTINSTEIQAPSNPSNNNPKQKLRKCTSLKVATTFTRVCLCAPISSYNEVFNGELLPPRRSYSYPRSMSNSNYKQPFPPPHNTHPQPTTTQLEMRVPIGRHSTEGRRVFRGKSLTDDVLMRRFVIEEEAMMQVRRRNQMEIIRRRSSLKRRKKLGPSPLCRMVLAEEDDDQLQQECYN
uniref:Uncharacterized protein n=1 Tax=Opuntia streptacantha TaxID=393608 RepID=A0A7C8YRQ9_OPUST